MTGLVGFDDMRMRARSVGKKTSGLNRGAIFSCSDVSISKFFSRIAHLCVFPPNIGLLENVPIKGKVGEASQVRARRHSGKHRDDKQQHSLY